MTSASSASSSLTYRHCFSTRRRCSNDRPLSAAGRKNGKGTGRLNLRALAPPLGPERFLPLRELAHKPVCTRRVPGKRNKGAKYDGPAVREPTLGRPPARLQAERSRKEEIWGRRVSLVENPDRGSRPQMALRSPPRIPISGRGGCPRSPPATASPSLFPFH